MLTDSERKALVLNKVSRSRETWAETEGIIEGGYWYVWQEDNRDTTF